MAHNLEIFDKILNDTLEREKNCVDVDTLNENLNNNDELILYSNNRSMNANFASLEIFIESLASKLFYICCSEAWTIDNPNFCQINGYNMYYNETWDYGIRQTV